ncbi:hypothetical protein LTR04_003122 [Oleoguttula sp. CCFEE 6159]|nr:hypothetical protein LTR04_003122 [Oleoguttula sp. CCFEE 6159]
MAEVTQAPATYKQPSRKGKKAWRKNVDISEVQEGLENVRDEVIEGGVIAEKLSTDLFALDTTGSAEIRQAYRKTHKPLKADEVLARRSAVPAVDSRKRKTTDGVLEPSSKRNRSGTYVSHRELQRLKSIAFGGETVSKDVVATEAPAHDPWALEEKTLDPKFSFLAGHVHKKPAREPKTVKEPPISLLASGKAVPAVKKPEAGKSYNPAFQDWEALLARAGDAEVLAEKKRLREAAEDLERTEKALAEATKPDPPSDNDYESAWESEWEGIASEVEGNDWLRKKRPERKTPAERNKVKRRKEAERLARAEKMMRRRDEQQKQIKSLARAVEEKERARASAAVESDASSSDGGDEVLRRRKFGRIPIPAPALELVLADELQDSLRRLRPEGNLLKDRYRNVLLNGKVESRRAITQPKMRKVTRTEKWTYKDWKLK